MDVDQLRELLDATGPLGCAELYLRMDDKSDTSIPDGLEVARRELLARITNMEAKVARLRSACDMWSGAESMYGAHQDLIARAELLSAHIAKQDVENAELRANDRRYRWLRHKMTCGQFNQQEEVAVIGAKSAAEMDEVIDALAHKAVE